MENQVEKTTIRKIFAWACAVYLVSLLIVVPFMTWRDAVYVCAIALMGCGLGKWKGSAYRSNILPLAVAYLAAKPFLHYGGNPTAWSWQRYVVMGETILLGLILLLSRPGIRLWPSWKSDESRGDPSQKPGFDPIELFPAAVVVALATLVGSCLVPYFFGKPLTGEGLSYALAALSVAVIYPALSLCFRNMIYPK